MGGEITSTSENVKKWEMTAPGQNRSKVLDPLAAVSCEASLAVKLH